MLALVHSIAGRVAWIHGGFFAISFEKAIEVAWRAEDDSPISDCVDHSPPTDRETLLERPVMKGKVPLSCAHDVYACPFDSAAD